MKTDERHEKSPSPIFLAGCELGEARHVCAFFNSREDEYGVTLPFIQDGFECGDKAVHIINPARRADHMQRLSFHGIDVPSSQQNGQLEVLDWKDVFFRDGPFDPDRQLALLEQVLRSGKEQGFRISRYVAHAEWALLLVEYFVGRWAKEAGKTIRRINKQTLMWLEGYHWPGNIRELQNVVERAVILCETDTFVVDDSWLKSESAESPQRRGLSALANREVETIEAG